MKRTLFLIVLLVMVLLATKSILEPDSSTTFPIEEKLSDEPLPSDNPISTVEASRKSTTSQINLLKDVGEAHLDYFGLSETDFKNIKNAGFSVIEGNFDICATDEDVLFFLNMAKKHGLRVVMPAGSGEAEWGYECETALDPNQKPIWQKEKVQNWLGKWKNHENIYAWDTSNEAGGVFPNSDKEFYLTEEQLRTAYLDVKEIDPNRPIMIRMNGWYFYDFDEDFFRYGNPFGQNVADIVMVNAYSNVDEYYNDFVLTVGVRANSSIKKINPQTKLILALGVWQETPLWVYPDPTHLENDYHQILQLDSIGVAFFKYGANGSEWYLPNEPKLWLKVQELIN